MDRITKALALAAAVHETQLDKGGKPYILHPLWVMSHMGREDECIVAVLHDTVEDAPPRAQAATISEIQSALGDEVHDAVLAITKREGEHYEDYLQRVVVNPLALKAKLWDIVHNLDVTRIPVGKADAKQAQRVNRYTRALGWLLGEATSHEAAPAIQAVAREFILQTLSKSTT